MTCNETYAGNTCGEEWRHEGLHRDRTHEVRWRWDENNIEPYVERLLGNQEEYERRYNCSHPSWDGVALRLAELMNDMEDIGQGEA